VLFFVAEVQISILFRIKSVVLLHSNHVNNMLKCIFLCFTFDNSTDSESMMQWAMHFFPNQ